MLHGISHIIRGFASLLRFCINNYRGLLAYNLHRLGITRIGFVQVPPLEISCSNSRDLPLYQAMLAQHVPHIPLPPCIIRIILSPYNHLC